LSEGEKGGPKNVIPTPIFKFAFFCSNAVPLHRRRAFSWDDEKTLSRSSSKTKIRKRKKIKT